MKQRSTNEHLKLGNCVAAYRRFHGLTQSQLASLCCVSKNTISSIENRIFAPSSYLAARICQVLHQPFETLFFLQ